MQDRDLLRAYLLNNSEPAFAELVARHINLVFACARRVVGDEDLAKDVCQKVFIHLAQKAGTVRDGDALAGWLYRVTSHTATSLVRAESRRRRRENEAMNFAEQQSSTTDTWPAIAPLLEEAMQRLSSDEQDAVVLRFFEGKSLREVGLVLSLSDDAAQKRVSRALDKMRAHFARRGVTSTVVALSALLAAHSAQAAPPGLAAGLAAGAFASASSGVGVGGLTASPLALIKGLGVAVSLIAAIGLVLYATRGSPEAAPAPRAVVSTDVPNNGNAGTPGTITIEAVLISSTEDGGAQFTLSTLCAMDEGMAIVEGAGTVHPAPANGSPGAESAAMVVEYRISWQLFDARPTPGVSRTSVALDNFDLNSSATLLPNTPFTVMNTGGKKVTLLIDGQKIFVTVTRASGQPAQ